MKNLLVGLMLLLATIACPSLSKAIQDRESSLTTYFKWNLPGKDLRTLIDNTEGFKLKHGNYYVTGPMNLKFFGERLLTVLMRSEAEIARLYGLKPGQREFIISIFPMETTEGWNLEFTVAAVNQRQLVFPLPVDADAPPDQFLQSFALFSLLHGLIKANLAFGSEDRLPISSHAFRFVDGLSGFIALEVSKKLNQVDQEKFFRILEIQHHKSEIARRYSAAQKLSQNSSSESTDMLAGLDQFFSGIRLTRDSENAIKLSDTSSTADRIGVFQLIQAQKGGKAIREIVAYLAKSSGIWGVQEKQEDSFCKKYIGIGCRERAIDGSRADIILHYVSAASFAQLLQEVRKEKTWAQVSLPEELPAYPVYGFDFPKAGGANESTFNLSYYRAIIAIDAKDIVEQENVDLSGIFFSLGIRDESYQIQIQLDYATGRKNRTDSLVFEGLAFEVPQKIVHTDLEIGTRIISRGKHSGWLDEIGVYFHWKRLQVEWELEHVSVKKTDLEYLNRGYFLLDIQNFKAIKMAGVLDLGINYDLQLGLVNQSGSTYIARDEKYNKDISNFILGANLGPEIRWQIPAIWLDLRMGALYNYLWQPLDDEGGRRGGTDQINATQSLTKIFATIGLIF